MRNKMININKKKKIKKKKRKGGKSGDSERHSHCSLEDQWRLVTFTYYVNNLSTVEWTYFTVYLFDETCHCYYFPPFNIKLLSNFAGFSL